VVDRVLDRFAKSTKDKLIPATRKLGSLDRQTLLSRLNLPCPRSISPAVIVKKLRRYLYNQIDRLQATGEPEVTDDNLPTIMGWKACLFNLYLTVH
jgi:hypothetical protein